MVNRKTASFLKLAALPVAALLAYSTPAQSVVTRALPLVAQSFPVPDSVARGTELQISSSSDNMNSIAEALEGGFESSYPNATVSVETKSADATIQDVLNGNADLGAISRPLTDAEKAQNLIEEAVRREKIAIIVGEDNPFAQSITGGQFAQIFRGEITNWSEVGGPDKPIRFIDRPVESETRQALRPYPVFVSEPFETGGNATQVSEDSIEAIASELGDDGISYALVGQLESAPNVKAVQLHQTLPDDPRYPFSQPYSFVYAGAASAPVQAFLGYATGAPGQSALNGANLPGYAVAPAAGNAAAGSATGDAATGGAASTPADGTVADGATGTTGADAEGNAAAGAAGSTIDPATGNSIAADGTVTDADGNVVTLEDGETAIVDGEIDGVAVDGDAAAGDLAGRGRWWWLLLPLAGLGLLIWAASKRGKGEQTGYIANADRDDTIRTNYRGGEGEKALATSGVGSRAKTGINTTVAGGTALAGGAAAAGAGLASRGKGLAKSAGDAATNLDGIKGSAQSGIDSVKGTAQGGLGNLRSNIQGGVDSARGNIQGGIDGARANTQGGLGNLKSNIQGGIDGAKGKAQEGVGGLKGGFDGIKGKAQGGIDGIKGQAQGGIDGVRGNVEGKVNNLRSDAQGKMDGMRGNIEGGVGDLRGRTQSGIEEAKGSVSDGSNSWLDRAKQRINQSADQVKDKASDIKDDVTGNS